MKPMKNSRRASVLRVASLAVLTAACDVTNPGPIQDEFLGDEAAQIGLIFGAQRSITTTFSGRAYALALVGRVTLT